MSESDPQLVNVRTICAQIGRARQGIVLARRGARHFLLCAFHDGRWVGYAVPCDESGRATSQVHVAHAQGARSWQETIEEVSAALVRETDRRGDVRDASLAAALVGVA